MLLVNCVQVFESLRISHVYGACAIVQAAVKCMRDGLARVIEDTPLMGTPVPMHAQVEDLTDM